MGSSPRPSDLPTVAAYLRRLPDGVSSHPECLVKASVLRDVIAGKTLSTALLGHLPAEVQALFREPPPVTAWVPEVHALLGMLAVRDAHFEIGPSGLERYETWCYERNSRLLSRPLYRVLFLVLTPDRLLDGVERRWKVFRKGTHVEVRRPRPGRASLRIVHPSHLYEITACRGLTGAIRAALELAGARDIRIELEALDELETRFAVSYRA